MFQLIVAVISIALVAALAIASIYYGGSAFSSSSLRANVVTLVNGGQQIAGAQALYRTDFGNFTNDITKLQATNAAGYTYLSSPPGKSTIANGAWTTDGVTANIPLASATGTCKEVSKQAGRTVPDDSVGALAAGEQFGCTGTTAAPVFSFKL